MPIYRSNRTAELVSTKKGSPRDKELAADPEWGRTPDKDAGDSPDLDGAHTAAVTEHPDTEQPTGGSKK
jgi:hypothetical protein